ncbi:ABC transporter, partial [Reticulomyxa filosa]
MPKDETVFELVRFSCAVTSDLSKTTAEEIVQKTNNVLKTLHLIKKKNQKIRYLSGGEYKRVSIATQLVTNPDILVLDEPTSGLDTPQALALTQTLRNVVNTLSCTIVLSIHQPQRRICDLFDWTLSFKDGRLIYQ